ncbi:lysyl-tRNA synthetase, class II [Serratia symbiotica str. 'Cinara cedri']|nr:lysyl-tRNA synthetase, class II [Serratia symbiotica str. 'Cinara cedri']
MRETASWQPSAPISNLLKRALILAETRRFFADRNVIEVETPMMSQASVTDIHLFPFETRFTRPGVVNDLTLYMITSPEYHMKRLLAAGSGSIYQIGRSFRNEEVGRYHNPEFTMLEWYRINYDMYQIMNEVDALLQQVLGCTTADTMSYQQAFIVHLNIDPLSADISQLRKVAYDLGLSNISKSEEDRDILLQLLLSVGVEPCIGHERPMFLYHFPASQALLSEINREDQRVSDRFEVYFKGIELANGFRELTDSHEQRCRFEQDNNKRIRRGLPRYRIDNNLLDALHHGIPACSGVALGFDRLIMLALGAQSISDVLAFPIGRA